MSWASGTRGLLAARYEELLAVIAPFSCLFPEPLVVLSSWQSQSFLMHKYSLTAICFPCFWQ